MKYFYSGPITGVTLQDGDKVLIEATGAYTTMYSSIGFNGFPPLKQYVI